MTKTKCKKATTRTTSKKTAPQNRWEALEQIFEASPNTAMVYAEIVPLVKKRAAEARANPQPAVLAQSGALSRILSNPQKLAWTLQAAVKHISEAEIEEGRDICLLEAELAAAALELKSYFDADEILELHWQAGCQGHTEDRLGACAEYLKAVAADCLDKMSQGHGYETACHRVGRLITLLRRLGRKDDARGYLMKLMAAASSSGDWKCFSNSGSSLTRAVQELLPKEYKRVLTACKKAQGSDWDPSEDETCAY